MFTETISRKLAIQLETGDTNAWLDMYAATPRDFANQFQIQLRQVGGVVLTLCKAIPFIHFNCVMNLGMNEPATDDLLDDIVAIYREASVPSFTFYYNPHCQPAQLPSWFQARGFRLQGGWERIYRNNAAVVNVIEPLVGFQVEKVTTATAPEWAAYIEGMYGLSATPWLLSLVERPGWHHYMLRQGTKIAAVRTMHIDPSGPAWLGIDAPVPGIMAPSFDLDRLLCQAIVQDGLQLGVNYFVADIEAPNLEMNTPAYQHFAALGFKRPYFRSHFGY